MAMPGAISMNSAACCSVAQGTPSAETRELRLQDVRWEKVPQFTTGGTSSAKRARGICSS